MSGVLSSRDGFPDASGATTPHRVVIRAVGGLEEIGWEEAPITKPEAGQVRVRVEFAGAAFGDVLLRRGVAGGRFPVTPGYDFVGLVEAVGPGANHFPPGARVVGFPGTGGQQDYFCGPETDLASVPEGIAPEKAVAAVLNYLTAYQLLTRAVGLKAGDTAFVYGLAGGLGSAMRQVAKPLGIKLYGTASPARLAQARDGATAFDRSRPDWPASALRVCPEGFDAVFDPVGGASLNRSYRLLSRRGTLAMIGSASSIQGSGSVRVGMVGTILRFALLKLRPDRRHARIVLVEGPTKNSERFRTDMAVLFRWMSEGVIDPHVQTILPLRDAATAQAMLESGDVAGKIVLRSRAERPC